MTKQKWIVDEDINIRIDKYLSDITEHNVYLLKLYTNKEISNSYYKLLCVERDEELYIYNYNDNSVLQFSKNI